MASSTTVEIGVFLTTGDAPYFRLNDPVKGKLNNTLYRLAGPIFYDITDKVTSVSVQRGKNRQLERYSAGRATVALNNEDRTFDPLNTSSIFYGNIIPRRAIRVRTGGFNQFVGLVEDWNFSYDVSGRSTAQIAAADGFTLLAQQSLTAGTATTQLTGARVEAVLSQPSVAWPLDQREIDSGLASVGSDVFPSSGSVLNYLQSVEASEQGQLFISRDGYVRFVNGGVTPTTQGSWVLSRTNISLNPRMVTATYPASNNGTLNPVTKNVAVPAPHPQGVATCLEGSSTGTNANLLSVFGLDAVINTGSPERASGVWVYVTESGYRVTAANGWAAQEITANTWTYVKQTGTTSAGAWAQIGVARISGNASTSARVYITGCISLSGTVASDDFFDGSTPATFTKRYGWNGTINLSSSYEETADVIAYPAFSDAGDGIPYTSADVSYGTELLFNNVQVSYPGGTAIANNADSQDLYGITTTSVDTLLSTGAAANSLALFWVAKYGEPEYRFESVDVSLDGLTGDEKNRILQLELGDIVLVKFTPNQIGDAIVKYAQIIGMQHTVTPDRHTITFGLGSLQFSFLVLDDTGFGILDENVLAF
jgi:hypothetical protein